MMQLVCTLSANNINLDKILVGTLSLFSLGIKKGGYFLRNESSSCYNYLGMLSNTPSLPLLGRWMIF